MINPEFTYNDLMNLCEEGDGTGFYFVDAAVSDTAVIRIFLYRLVGGSQWSKPGARWSRGTVFFVPKDGEPELLSRCMPKFFNVDEGPHAPAGTDLTDDLVEDVFEKWDGSLITLFRVPEHVLGAVPELQTALIPGTDIAVKSKGSFWSSQAEAARDFIYEREVKAIVGFNESLNFEWCSPDNRIVVPYRQPRLRYLNTVVHDTGEILMPGTAREKSEVTNPEALRIFVDDAVHCEGYIVRFKSGEMAKIKNKWYMTLHHARDNFQSNKHLVRCVWDGGMDDLKAWFSEDREFLEELEQWAVFELKFYMRHMNDMFIAVKDLPSRKQQALTAMELNADIEKHGAAKRKLCFSWVMQKLDGKTPDNVVEKLKEAIAEDANIQFTSQRNNNIVAL